MKNWSCYIPTWLQSCPKLLVCGALLAGSTSSFSSELKVMVSIKPLHSLVSAVMAGVAEPTLLQETPDSPHQHSLKPSKAKNLEQADLLFWFGPALSPHLAKAVDTLLSADSSINVLAVPELAAKSYSGDEIDDLAHLDPHVWLDPRRAATIVQHITTILARADPANDTQYQQNGAAVLNKLEQLDSVLSIELDGIDQAPVLVMHSAYQYFAERYNTGEIVALLNDDDHSPGAKRVSDINQLINDRGIRCMLVEPQFNNKIVAALSGKLTTVTIDPVGSDLKPGPQQYFDMMTRLAAGFGSCVAQNL